MTSPVRRLAALALLIVALAACGGGAATPAPAATTASDAGAGAAAPAALPAEVDVAKAKDLQTAGAFVLDVREPEEWVAGHIDGATLIPLGELPDRVKEVPADRQVVVVCRSGNRSQAGRDILLDAGLPSVTSMAGGVNDWGAASDPASGAFPSAPECQRPAVPPVSWISDGVLCTAGIWPRRPAW
jgi:phage shock protein E